MIKIVTTTDKESVAKKIIKELLDNQICACTWLENIQSSYVWNQKIVSSKEYKLSIKTFKKYKHEIIKTIKKHHNYDTIFIGVYKFKINKKYKQWFKNIIKEHK